MLETEKRIIPYLECIIDRDYELILPVPIKNINSTSL